MLELAPPIDWEQDLDKLFFSKFILFFFKYSTFFIIMYHSPHNSKVKSHLKFTELDINASQACLKTKAKAMLSEALIHNKHQIFK